MLVSSVSALMLYAIVGLAFFAAGILRPDELGRHSGPIKVRIGTADGVDEFSRILPKALSSRPAASGIAPAALPPPPAAAAPKSPEPASSSQAKAVPAPSPSASAVATPSKASPPSPSPTIASAAPGIGTPVPGEGEGVVGGSPLGTGSVSLKGSEQGNSFETSYESGTGKIGRSLYVPIYLYMPLPTVVSKAIYDAIKASKDGLRSAEIRKVEFRSYYDLNEDGWRLKAQPAYALRPTLWQMLRDGGYSLSRAEYKVGKDLKPVALSFEVGAPQGSSGPPLLSVTVVSSSGYPELDAAVVFGFRQAAFFNDSAASVTGRFTYRFE